MARLNYPNNRSTLLELEEHGDDVILIMKNPDHPELKLNVAIIKAKDEHDLTIRGLL